MIEEKKCIRGRGSQSHLFEFTPTTETTEFDLVVSNLPRGDMNGDKKITPIDATTVLRAVVGLIELRTDQRILGDVTGDGTISAYDAAVILQKYN